MYDELREAGYERYVIEALETLEQSQLDVNCESMGVVACENDCGLMEGEYAKRGGDWEVVDEPCEDFHVFTPYDEELEWGDDCVLMELKKPTACVNSSMHGKLSVESERVSEPLILKNKRANEFESEIACEFEVVSLWSNEIRDNSLKRVGLAPSLSNKYDLIENDVEGSGYEENHIISNATKNFDPSLESMINKDEYWGEFETFGTSTYKSKPTYLLFELKLCELSILSKLIHYLHSRENCSSLFDKLMRSLVGFLIET